MPPQLQRPRTEEPETVAKGSAPLSQVQRLSTRATQNPRDTELDTLSQRACALIPALAGKLLRFCLLSFCTVAWFCTRECPGGHWPACYDQTRGFPGEGPLDSPDMGPSLTPTQELQTCSLKRRTTRGIKWENRVCRACEKVLKPKQNGHTCLVCRAWACSAPCERAL